MEKLLEEKKLKIVILVGLSGSGKTAVTETYAENGYEIISTGAIRKKLYGNVYPKNQENVFWTLRLALLNNIKNNIDTVIDATNVDISSRETLIKIIKNTGKNVTITALVIATPYKDCISNLNGTNSRVTKDIINKQRKKFCIPFKEEGFDHIDFHCDIKYKDSGKELDQLTKEMLVVDECMRLKLNNNQTHSIDTLTQMSNIYKQNKHNTQLFEDCLIGCFFHEYGNYTDLEDEEETLNVYNCASAGTYEYMVATLYNEAHNILDENSKESLLNILFFMNYHTSKFINKSYLQYDINDQKYKYLKSLSDMERMTHIPEPIIGSSLILKNNIKKDLFTETVKKYNITSYTVTKINEDKSIEISCTSPLGEGIAIISHDDFIKYFSYQT